MFNQTEAAAKNRRCSAKPLVQEKMKGFVMEAHHILSIIVVISVISAVFWLQATFVTTFRERIGNRNFFLFCIAVFALLIVGVIYLSK